jgi:CheY-like chemotaxis protein
VRSGRLDVDGASALRTRLDFEVDGLTPDEAIEIERRGELVAVEEVLLAIGIDDEAETAIGNDALDSAGRQRGSPESLLDELIRRGAGPRRTNDRAEAGAKPAGPSVPRSASFGAVAPCLREYNDRGASTEVTPIARTIVVDDDADIAELLCDLLEYLGHEATPFASVLPGLGELSACRPDLIVIDIGLHPAREQQSGLQVVHAARSGEPLRDVPIIVLATDPKLLSEAMPDLMRRGDIHRLDKPFDLLTFERVVHMALGSGPSVDRMTSGRLRLMPEEAEAAHPRARSSG